MHFLGQQSGLEAAGSLIDSLLVISTLFSWKVNCLSGKNFSLREEEIYISFPFSENFVSYNLLGFWILYENGDLLLWS